MSESRMEYAEEVLRGAKWEADEGTIDIWTADREMLLFILAAEMKNHRESIKHLRHTIERLLS